MSMFFNRERRPSLKNSAFTITQTGRSKLSEFTGDPQSRILMALESHEVSELQELSRYSNLSPGQVERLLPKMIRHGLVQVASTTGGDDL